MRKIFIFLISLIFTLSLAGCKSEYKEKIIKESKNFKYINHIVLPSEEKEYKRLDKTDSNTYNKFAYNTFSKMYKDDTNNFYSPASLYMALSMIAEGADGNSLEEIKAALGDMSYIKNTNKLLYSNNYYKNDKGEASIANSYWIKLDIDVKDEFINTLNDYYYAEGFKCEFDSEAKSNMAKWVNNKTKGLLDAKENDFAGLENMKLCFINTVYFDNKWLVEYETSNTRTDKFYVDNNSIDCSFMNHTISSAYYTCDKYSSVVDSFHNGNSITYILPNEGIDIKDIIDDIDFKNNEDYYDASHYTVHLYVPKFKYNVRVDLKDTLISLGVQEVFSKVNANLSKISDTPLYLDQITQGAGIEINESGVKAAAFTKGFTGAKASDEPREVIDFKLNRPFIYYISDSNGCILFMGSIDNPNK